MRKEDLLILMEEYLEYTGEWFTFKEFIEDQGYTTKELGFPE